MYRTTSPLYRHSIHFVIFGTPRTTANEMKLWIFKLFLPHLLNNEQYSGSWGTEFPFCERGKRRWRVGGGNGKQTSLILCLFHSLFMCRLSSEGGAWLRLCLLSGMYMETHVTSKFSKLIDEWKQKLEHVTDRNESISFQCYSRTGTFSFKNFHLGNT